MKALLPLLLLAGCAALAPQADPVPPPDLSAKQLPPGELTRCPSGVAGPLHPPEPPSPRTVDQVRDWAYAQADALDAYAAALAETEAARRECRRRLGAVIDWYQQRRE